MFKTVLAGTLLVSALGALPAIASPDDEQINRAFEMASSGCYATHLRILQLTKDRIAITSAIAETGMRPELEARLIEVDKALRPHLEDSRQPECDATIQMYEGLVRQEADSALHIPGSIFESNYRIALEHGDVCASSMASLEETTARRKNIVSLMKNSDGAELTELHAELIAIDTRIALDLAEQRDASCATGTVAWTEDPHAWRVEQCMLIAARLGQIEDKLAPLVNKVRDLDGRITALSMNCATPTTGGFCMIERNEIARKLDGHKEERNDLLAQRSAQTKRARSLSCHPSNVN